MNRIFHHSALLGQRLNWLIERICALLVALMVIVVITSYSIHYTKLYDPALRPPPSPGKEPPVPRSHG